jgi:DMSO/TMAO reductase YedYZ heme-binding membrane subunit
MGEINSMGNIWKRIRLVAYLTFFTGLALFLLAVDNNSNASWGLLLVSSSALIYLVANTIRIMEVLAIAKRRK